MLNFELLNAQLASLLREYDGKKVYYFSTPGNGGDSLIAAATYQILRRYGINVEFAPRLNTIRNSTVFLGGGGNLIPLYGGMARALKLLVPRKNRIVMLPHTIRGNEELIASLPSTVTLFCREAESYLHVLKHATDCEVLLGHDMAVFGDHEAILGSSETRRMAEPRFIDTLSRVGVTPQQLEGRDLQCLRTDREKPFRPSGENYDISRLFTTGVVPGNAEIGAWMMLEFVRLAGSVTTNRLHTGIACAIAGKQVTLQDNTYGKISSIYRHSLRGRFPNVNYVAAGAATGE